MTITTEQGRRFRPVWIVPILVLGLLAAFVVTKANGSPDEPTRRKVALREATSTTSTTTTTSLPSTTTVAAARATPVTTPRTTSPPATQPSSASCNSGAGGTAANRVAGLYCARRSSAGLALVRRTSALDRVAQGWADQLAQMHDTSLPHNPNYRSQALAACSSCTGWAENVGYWEGDDPDAVWNLWLNSPPHRANIDNASSGEFGIGVAYSDDGWLWIVHDFGRY